MWLEVFGLRLVRLLGLLDKIFFVLFSYTSLQSLDPQKIQNLKIYKVNTVLKGSFTKEWNTQQWLWKITKCIS